MQEDMLVQINNRSPTQSSVTPPERGINVDNSPEEDEQISAEVEG